jgi:hypothetical protein
VRPDLSPAGQEGEHVAGMGRERRADRARHRPRQVARIGQVAGAVLDRHGPGAAEALNDGGGVSPLAQQPGEERAVERRRHRQQAQLRPQGTLQVEAEREGQVGVEVALMRLVEQDGRDALQPRIGLQAADQQPLRYHLDPRAGGMRAVEPGREADRAARRALPHQLRHAPRGGAGRDAPRLQHQDLLAVCPGLLHQHQGHRRGLSAPGGATRTAFGPLPQGGGKPRQGLGDGQLGQVHARRC